MGIRLSKMVQDNLYRQRRDILEKRMDEKRSAVEAKLKKYEEKFDIIKRDTEYQLSTIEPKFQKLDIQLKEEERAALAAIAQKYAKQREALIAQRDKAQLPLKKFYENIEAELDIENVSRYFRMGTAGYIYLKDGDTSSKAAKELTTLLLDLELSDNASMRDLVAKWLAA